MKKVRVGVVGVGKLGESHLHHYLSIPGVEVMGVFDLDNQRLQEIISRYEVHPFKNIEEIIKSADAISIVTSTSVHYEIAKTAIEHGLNVFIEKPMTTTIEQADDIVNLQKSKGTIVQIGLIERFNPAFTALDSRSIHPLFIESHRLAPFTARGADVSVVLDLMIHDIDLVLKLVPADVKNIEATGFSAISGSIDFANAHIQFTNGTNASLIASRIAPERVRKMSLFQSDSTVIIDFLKKETEIYRFSNDSAANSRERVMGQMNYKGRSRFLLRQDIEVRFVDALQEELTAFIRSVRGESPPVVTAEEGRRALATSLAVMRAIEK